MNSCLKKDDCQSKSSRANFHWGPSTEHHSTYQHPGIPQAANGVFFKYWQNRAKGNCSYSARWNWSWL